MKAMTLLSIFIPVVGVAILGYLYGTKIHTHIYAIMLFGVPLFVFLLSLLFKGISNRSTEYLGGYVTNITYYEPWNEEVRKTREVEDGTDEDGHTSYRTEVYYEIEEHPARYTYNTNIGKNGSISSFTFQEWKSRLGDSNPAFIDMHRNYYDKDGDAWEYNWNGRDANLVPVTFTHSYFNPLKHSNSLYKHEEIGKDSARAWGLFDYPVIAGEHYQNCVVSETYYPNWDKRLQCLNARLGSSCQFRMFLLVFNGRKYKIEDVFYKQKAYWNGGNKNEFVLCVGLDLESKKLLWHNSFSWCKEPKLEAEVRNYLSTKDTFYFIELCDWMENVIPGSWDRRQFSEFKYLSTTMPTWCEILLLVLSILATLGVGYWALTEINVL